MSLKAARTLAEIATNCTPDPLEKDKLKAFFVPTDEARDEKTHLCRHLVGIFNKDDQPKRVLVYGHRGCGKSTELNHFKGNVGPQWFIVDFSIKNYLPPVGIKAEDILLAMSVAILDKLNDKESKDGEAKLKVKISEDHLQKIHDFFADLTVTSAEGRDSEAKVSAEASAGSPSLLASIFKLKASVSSEISFGSKNEKTKIQQIKQRPGDLILAVNGLLHAVEEALKEHDKKLLLIIEDLDKLQLAEAYDVFVQNHNLLAKLTSNIIYTIPIFTFYTPDRDVIQSAFDAHLHLQMIKVFNRDGSPAAGYEKVKEIVLKRVSEEMFLEDSLDLLIRGTGGVLRHVFEVLQEVSGYYNIRDQHIRAKDIRAALNNLRINIGTAIGWPLKPDGSQDKPDALYDTLFDAAKTQLKGDKYEPRNDQSVHVLLRSCALIEYNGDRWLGVHPLAWEYLANLGKDPGPNPYLK
jgi:energy-coupling factor transporter ATP-binding protein EcfA2